MARLGDVCKKGTSNIAQKDLEGHSGIYPIYGASGFITNVDFYQQENSYIAVVKDGAGIGRIMKLPAKSSVIGTMQYIIPNDTVDISYLAYAMEHMNLSKYFTGATIPHIYFKDYQKEELPLPPLDEQRKIAAVLDKVSDLIAKRRQQLDKLDELIKARFVEMFGDMVNNPKAWDTYSLDDCFEITSSKRILKSEWKDSGIPFLRVRDMVQLATTGKVDNEFFISEEFYASLSDSDGIPKEGDILVSATSTLGKCYVVGKGERFYFKDADVLRLRAKKEINPIFFIEQMKTGYIEEQISKTLGVTTVAHFTIKAAKIINMRCPNIELQNQFAAFVEQTEKTKTTISESLQQLETLKKALMQEYFG